jgi:putative endonuclease
MSTELTNTKSWYVYMIRSDDDQLYTGITTDIARRWQEHSTGKIGARYFRGRKPLQLCLLENHPDRSSASKREAALKQLTRRAKEHVVSAQDAAALAAIHAFNHALFHESQP